MRESWKSTCYWMKARSLLPPPWRNRADRKAFSDIGMAGTGRAGPAFSGIHTICSGCGRGRDANGEWGRPSGTLRQFPEPELSHGICPDCMVRLYPEFAGRLSKAGPARNRQAAAKGNYISPRDAIQTG